MKSDKDILKNIEILSMMAIQKKGKNITLIHGDEQGTNVSDLNIFPPVNFEKLVLFSLEESAENPKYDVKLHFNLKATARSLRNMLLNVYTSMSLPLKVDNYYIDLRGHSPNNVAHLMMEFIPVCTYIKNNINENVHFIIDKPSAPFNKLLQIFGIQPMVTNRKIAGKALKFYGTRCLAAYDALWINDYPFITYTNGELDKNHHFSSKLLGTEKIFIARKDTRTLTNFTEIEMELANHGYRTIFMEDYPLEVQLGIGAEASEIVAIHGASMGMLVMSQKIKSIIEILPPNVYHDYFPIALGMKVEQYIQIISVFDGRTPYNGWRAIREFKYMSFTADINQLRIALRMISNNQH